MSAFETSFTAHEGQDTVIVRGSMHHMAMTVSEFSEWLADENCTHNAWTGPGVSQTTLVRRNDGSIRCIAMRLASENFEPVY